MQNVKQYRKISVADLFQDASNLRVLCEKDRLKLEDVGLQWDIYDELVERTDTAMKLELELAMYKKDYGLEAFKLRQFAKECSTLRTELRRQLNQAFMLAGSNVVFPGVSGKRSYADISQDLLDLAVSAESLLKRNSGCMQNISIIEKARDYSNTLFERVAKHQCMPPWATELNHRYKNAVSALKQTIQHIRKIGQQAFQDNPTRRKAYSSNYLAYI